jgi:triosephosphate isomerase (TIM)
MKKIIIANWKMNLDQKETIDLAKSYYKNVKPKRNTEVVIAPSFPMLKEVQKIFSGTNFILGAQDVAAQESGAYTGEVSSRMLKDFGCKYVLVGHSERRLFMNETNEIINKKINQCFNMGLSPILCVGETLQENKDDKREYILVQQLQQALSKVNGLPENELVIAYEPIWAIGSGQFMEAKDLQTIQSIVKRVIFSLYSEKFYNEKVRLIYGGSVNSINANDFLSEENISGLLVATASLESGAFRNIVEQA